MDKKQVTFRIEPPLLKKLKFLAVEHDKSLTALFIEALQDLLRKYEKPTKKPKTTRQDSPQSSFF
jgi:hypothetical protein